MRRRGGRAERIELLARRVSLCGRRPWDSDPGEDPMGRSLLLPMAKAISTCYGSETVVLSPLAEITKVPDAVSLAKA